LLPNHPDKQVTAINVSLVSPHALNGLILKMNRTIEELAANFAELEAVEALVLAGSAATGLADEWSDYDLYANTRGGSADRVPSQITEASGSSFRAS
jgi:hypothetical protein